MIMYSVIFINIYQDIFKFAIEIQFKSVQDLFFRKVSVTIKHNDVVVVKY